MRSKKDKFMERSLLFAIILCLIGAIFMFGKVVVLSVKDVSFLNMDAQMARTLASNNNLKKIDMEAGRQQLVDVLTKVREQAKTGAMSLNYDYSADVPSWESYTKEKLRARNFKLASDFRDMKELDSQGKSDIVYWGAGEPRNLWKINL